MGVLDDAIREHLELKRRHGASDSELKRQAAEALGPARREPRRSRERDESGGEPVASAKESDEEPVASVKDVPAAAPESRAVEEEEGCGRHAVPDEQLRSALGDDSATGDERAAESEHGTLDDRAAVAEQAPDDKAARPGDSGAPGDPGAGEALGPDEKPAAPADRAMGEELDPDEVPAEEVLEGPRQPSTAADPSEPPATSPPPAVFDVESLEAEPAEYPPPVPPGGASRFPEDGPSAEQPAARPAEAGEEDTEEHVAQAPVADEASPRAPGEPDYVEAELVDEELVDESELEDDDVLDDTELLDDDLVVEGGRDRAEPAAERPASFDEDTIFQSPTEPASTDTPGEDHLRALEDEYGTDEEDLEIHDVHDDESATAFASPAGADPEEGALEEDPLEEERLADEDELEAAERAAEEALEDEELVTTAGLSPDEEDARSAEEEAAGDEGDEDVLEETPEFLEETPENERLWFEQRSPRDVDLDR